MDFRVAVHFGRGCLQDRDAKALGEAEHVQRPEKTRLRGLDRIVLVVHRRRGTGEIVNLVHFDLQRCTDVVPDHFEIPELLQMQNVLTFAGKEVVDTEYGVAALQQPLAKMRTDEARAAGDKHAPLLQLCCGFGHFSATSHVL